MSSTACATFAFLYVRYSIAKGDSLLSPLAHKEMVINLESSFLSAIVVPLTS